MRYCGRRAAFTVALALLCNSAAAEDFAILSVIGSQVVLVKYEGQTGSLRKVSALVFDVADDAMDGQAAEAAEAVLHKRDAGTGVAKLSVRDRKWIAAVREAAADESGDLDRLLQPVVEAASSAGASRLILILPARADIRIEVQEGFVGQGRAAGVGMYVDRQLRIRHGDTLLSGGLLGMFVNFRLVLVDVQTKRRLGESVVAAGHSYSGATSPDSDPLNALSAEQKLAAWRRVLAASLERALPPVLDRAGR